MDLPSEKRESPARLATMHARSAFDLASAFEEHFGQRSFGARPEMRLRFSEPTSLSTAAGRLACFKIVLESTDGLRRQIVCGQVNTSEKSAEWKVYEALLVQYERQHKERLPLHSPEYANLASEVQAFFAAAGYSFQWNRAAAAGAELPEAPERALAGSLSPLATVGLGLLVGLFGLVLWLILRR